MRLSSLALALVAAGCWTPNPPDGAFACNPGGKACPDGYSCIAGSCWKNGHVPDMALDTSCTDGVKDGTESDVDCGGGCGKCDVGKACASGDDCTSTFCSATTSLCVATSCEDGILSAGETDVDCGGGTCPACVVGKTCMSGTDCASMDCDAGTHVCVSLQCQDGVKDGNETDVDCGGGVCALCATNQRCVVGQDCASTFCSANSKICVATRCADETKNGSETDVDCGGGCMPCAANLACNVPGDCATGSCLANYCALASGPPNWIAAASITPRYSLGAATGSDGKLYAIGGDTSSAPTVTATVESYALGQWTAATSLPAAMGSLCATATLDGKIYTVGGGNGSGAVATINVLTPGSGWAAGPSLPTAIDGNGCATGPDGKIYSIGGSTTSGRTSLSYALTPGSAWAPIPDLPVATTVLSAATGIDGRIYATGGIQVDSMNNVVFSTKVYAYSPAQTKWASVADMVTGRMSHATATGADGRTYVFGGGGSGGTIGSCEAYTPSTNTWVPCAGLMMPRSNVTGALGPDGHMYAIGGYVSAAVGNVEAYGPTIATSPTSGTAGTSVALSGSNFAANATVSVRFGVLTGQVLGTGVTDTSGALIAPISFTIPNATPATYKLFVSDNRSQYPVSTILTITP